jgi:hypothetical protein
VVGLGDFTDRELEAIGTVKPSAAALAFNFEMEV